LSQARDAAAGTVQLRPERLDDRQFLFDLYASTRAGELDRTGWDEAKKHAFLQMQFEAQHTHYSTYFSDASFDVVEVDGRPIGRLYVYRRPTEVTIMDITLLPDRRNAGIGTALLRSILDEAGSSGAVVTLHVERWNPAKRLYDRLGFVEVSDDGLHVTMRRVS
jgi:ribosomal protein S18 acetylase RimI-like enzyme